MSDDPRLEFRAPTKAAEIARLRQLYSVAEAAYVATRDEWEQAVGQARLWHRYEQALVSQRNAMHSALSNLWTAIKAVEEIEGLHGSTDQH